MKKIFKYSALALISAAIVSCNGNKGSKNDENNANGENAAKELAFSNANAGDEVFEYLSFEGTPGQLSVDDRQVTLSVVPKILKSSGDMVVNHRDASIILLDENGNVVADLGGHGIWSDLNDAMLSGNTSFSDAIEAFTFMDSAEEAADVASKAVSYKINFPMMDKSELEETDKSESSAEEAGDDVTATTPMSQEDYVLVPLNTSVSGSLKGYVSVVDKEYRLNVKDWYGDPFYELSPSFDIDKTMDLGDNHLSVSIMLYDANKKPIHFTQLINSGDPNTAYSNDKFGTNGSSLLVKALKDGGTCSGMVFDIMSWFIADFNPEVIAKAKYFQVYTEVLDKYGMAIE